MLPPPPSPSPRAAQAPLRFYQAGIHPTLDTFPWSTVVMFTSRVDFLGYCAHLPLSFLLTFPGPCYIRSIASGKRQFSFFCLCISEIKCLVVQPLMNSLAKVAPSPPAPPPAPPPPPPQAATWGFLQPQLLMSGLTPLLSSGATRSPLSCHTKPAKRCVTYNTFDKMLQQTPLGSALVLHCLAWTIKCVAVLSTAQRGTVRPARTKAVGSYCLLGSSRQATCRGMSVIPPGAQLICSRQCQSHQMPELQARVQAICNRGWRQSAHL